MDKNKRSEIARNAVNERWHPTIPKATHTGVLVIGGQEIACDVLNNGKRILRQKAFLKALGRGNVGGKDQKRAEDTNLPIFLIANNLKPYLKPEILVKGDPISYRGIDGRKFIGYDATFLPEVCKVYVQADHDKVFKDSPGQTRIAAVCKAILYGLSTVGIMSLVDDVTGFVNVRNKTELQRILEGYISEELRAWTKKFPDEFFKQIYRINDWKYLATTHHKPQCIGNFINKYIYEKLPPGVLDELKKKNPPNESGNRHYRHHQFLSESIGDDNLQKQILQTITIMKVSDDMDQFKELINRVDNIWED